MPPKSSKWKPVGESFTVDGAASAYQTYACLRCGKEFKSRVGAQAQFAKGTDPSRPWTDRMCDQGMAACDAGECVPAGATSRAEAAASSVVTAAGSRAEAAASSSSGVVEVSSAEDRPPPSALSSHPPALSSLPSALAMATSETAVARRTHRAKRSISEANSYELCEDVRHNIRQLSDDEWIAGGAARFHVTTTKRRQLERAVRLAHAPVAGLDLLGTGDVPPKDALVTVVVARAAASVEIIGLSPMHLAVAEACAFDATLIVRLGGDAFAMHFGLRDVEGGQHDPGKARRGKGYADIPSLEDDRHSPTGDATSPTAAEQCVAAAEQRAAAAEQRAIVAEQRAAEAEERATAATDALTQLKRQAQSAAPLRREVVRGLLPKLHPDRAKGRIKRRELRAIVEVALAAYPESKLYDRLVRMCDRLDSSGYVERIAAYQEISEYVRE